MNLWNEIPCCMIETGSPKGIHQVSAETSFRRAEASLKWCSSQLSFHPFLLVQLWAPYSLPWAPAPVPGRRCSDGYSGQFGQLGSVLVKTVTVLVAKATNDHSGDEACWGSPLFPVGCNLSEGIPFGAELLGTEDWGYAEKMFPLLFCVAILSFWAQQDFCSFFIVVHSFHRAIFISLSLFSRAKWALRTPSPQSCWCLSSFSSRLTLLYGGTTYLRRISLVWGKPESHIKQLSFNSVKSWEPWQPTWSEL